MTPRHGWLPTACRRALCVAGVALELLAGGARGGSLTVRGAAGDQWRAISDPADEAQGYVLERLRSDGQPDPRFGRGGRRPLTISPSDDAPTALRVDARGRIWASGASIAGGQPQAVILRYLPDGAPDLDWGVQGKVQLLPGGLAIKPNDLLPLSDGSVLVAGVASNVEPIRAVVFRLKPDGALDRAFGSSGTWQRVGAEGGSTATSLAVADNGAVAVCVAARGDDPMMEIWSIAMPTPRLLQQQPLDAGADGEDVQVVWAGGRWAFAAGGAPTVAGLAGTLDPAGFALARPAEPASSDPGAGGFSPFDVHREEPATAPVVSGDASRVRDVIEAASILAAVVTAAVVLRRARKRD